MTIETNYYLGYYVRNEVTVITKHSFQLDCIGCKHPIAFSVVQLEEQQHIVSCQSCGKKYGLGDTSLKRQLKKFASLCLQIKESEEILGNASIAVDVGKSTVQVPFKLLLTRLKSTLDLTIQGEKIVVTFRSEPTA